MSPALDPPWAAPVRVGGASCYESRVHSLWPHFGENNPVSSQQMIRAVEQNRQTQIRATFTLVFVFLLLPEPNRLTETGEWVSVALGLLFVKTHSHRAFIYSRAQSLKGEVETLLAGAVVAVTLTILVRKADCGWKIITAKQAASPPFPLHPCSEAGGGCVGSITCAGCSEGR